MHIFSSSFGLTTVQIAVYLPQHFFVFEQYMQYVFEHFAQETSILNTTLKYIRLIYATKVTSHI
jgi:hypothetical protein